MRTHKIIKVEWIDTCAQRGWLKREKMQEHGELKCVSCGIQVKTKGKTIGVTASLSESDDVDDTIIIPRKVISSIETLGTFKL